MEKCFGDLQFLSDEFSKLEVMVAPESNGGESHSARTAEVQARPRMLTDSNNTLSGFTSCFQI